MSNGEEWAGIVGAPGYAINRDGVVINTRTRRTLATYTSSYGLDKVSLYVYGVRKDVYIHKLLESAFERPNILPATYRYLVINETGHRFQTVEECASFLGTHPSAIYRVLRGERLSHRGMTFRFTIS